MVVVARFVVVDVAVVDDEVVATVVDRGGRVFDVAVTTAALVEDAIEVLVVEDVDSTGEGPVALLPAA